MTINHLQWTASTLKELHLLWIFVPVADRTMQSLWKVHRWLILCGISLSQCGPLWRGREAAAQGAGEGAAHVSLAGWMESLPFIRDCGGSHWAQFYHWTVKSLVWQSFPARCHTRSLLHSSFPAVWTFTPASPCSCIIYSLMFFQLLHISLMRSCCSGALLLGLIHYRQVPFAPMPSVW